MRTILSSNPHLIRDIAGVISKSDVTTFRQEEHYENLLPKNKTSSGRLEGLCGFSALRFFINIILFSFLLYFFAHFISYPLPTRGLFDYVLGSIISDTAVLSLIEMAYWMFLKYQNDRKDFVSYLLSLCCSKRIGKGEKEEGGGGEEGGGVGGGGDGGGGNLDLLPYFYCVGSEFHGRRLKEFLDERCSVVAGCCLLRFMVC